MYKTIDLFAGIGGIRRGFEMTGRFKNVLSAEIDKYACITYEHLFGESPFNDVTSEEFKEKVAKTEYDTLLAGFPCQAFSRAGKQEGFLDSTRGTLFFDVADIIKRTRPKTFLLENVDNLLSHDKGNTFKVILEVLINELGYKIVGVTKDSDGNLIYDNKSLIRNSRNFGIPQNRPRVYIMGFDRKYFGDQVDNLPQDNLPESRNGKPIYNDLNALLEFNAPADYYVAQGYLDTLKKHRERHKGKGNGFGYMVVNEPSIENPYSNAILATGGSGKERNLVYDPQEGIAGTIVKNKQTPLNNEHIRHMTPREWGKLQGFIGYAFIDENGEDRFTTPPKMSNTQLYKQFGNSVTIPVIEQMAIYMNECIVFLNNELRKEKEKYEQAI
jgi:DNA (cytosine-5)-methyltransferase 1